MKLRHLLLIGLLAACPAQALSPPGTTGRDALDRTAEAHAHDVPVATPAASTTPVAAVTGRTVSYGKAGGVPVQGYFVQPANARAPLPGLIVIHEWWGLNDNVRAEAARLAAEGYAVLAVDLYGGKSATTPPEAIQLSRQLAANAELAGENLRAAYAYLDTVARAPRIGTIGWCLGGAWSLRTALLLPGQVDAAVIYYGTLSTDEAGLARLGMPVLGLFASQDRVVPVATVKAFEATMRRLGKDVDVHVYEGTEHAFANPSGTAYEPRAAEDAWRRTTAFLSQHLAP